MNTSAGQHEVRTFGAAGDPPVLLLHPWWGVTPAIEEWAEALAGIGRRVVLPDLYGGRIARTIEEAEAASEVALSDPVVIRLIEQCADDIAGQGQPWAAMGFSMGGFLACPLAGRGDAGPDDLILFYGGQPPAGQVSRTSRVDLHVAPDDDYFTADEIAEVAEAFTAAGIKPQTSYYDGSGHWFAERGSPGFDEAAFTLARTRVIERLRG